MAFLLVLIYYAVSKGGLQVIEKWFWMHLKDIRFIDLARPRKKDGHRPKLLMREQSNPKMKYVKKELDEKTIAKKKMQKEKWM